MSSISDLEQKIKSKEHVIGVIGLGYVGLPLVQAICSKTIKAIGFDVDSKKIEYLEQGKSYIDGVKDEAIVDFMQSGLFRATADFSNLSDVDIIIICVPTPLDSEGQPDLSYVKKTTDVIAQYMRDGQMVILESTTYPGTVSDVMQPILLKAAQEKHVSYYIAYSPEREDPGNKDFSTSSTPKLVGADTPEVLQAVTLLYEQFIANVVGLPSIKVAEAAKITENIFRAVNIALVNELKVIYDKMDIDIWQVIEAAKTKPFGYMPFYPGPGIGGHCIPIDPIYLSWKAAQSGKETKFIELASTINQSMTDYICEKLTKALALDGVNGLSGKRILILGVAYKKNVKDQRESPAFPLMKKLQSYGAQIGFHDPCVTEILPNRHFSEFQGMDSVAINSAVLNAQDALIIVTDHDDVDYEAVVAHSALVIDTRNAIESRGVIVGSSTRVIKA